VKVFSPIQLSFKQKPFLRHADCRRRQEWTPTMMAPSPPQINRLAGSGFEVAPLSTKSNARIGEKLETDALEVWGIDSLVPDHVLLAGGASSPAVDGNSLGEKSLILLAVEKSFVDSP
jgi:hypothetical protein